MRGTQLRAARADPDVMFSWLVRRETNPDEGADAVLWRISEAIRETAVGEPVRAI